MKAMCCHNTLNVLSKTFPNNVNEAPCTACFTAKTTIFPKGTTFDITYLQEVELIHMKFVFYNVTSVQGFTSMLSVVCEKTRMVCILPTDSKKSPVRII